MKNNDDENNLSKASNFTHHDTKIDSVKTTNINILLNRVKLDKKKENRKIILLFITAIVSLLFFGILIF
jgi:hypothetical protein